MFTEKKTPTSGICQICGCTDRDCAQCIERTGEPCGWANIECTICTACITSQSTRDARQREILQWACTTFGTETAGNLDERLRRFAEEAVELVQSAGLDEQAMLDLVKYVYSRPAGDTEKEIGQVGVALLGLAEHLKISAELEEQKEFDRITSLPPEHWQARQNAKADKGIALPATPEESCRSFS